MDARIDGIVERLRRIEDELEWSLRARRRLFRYRVYEGRVQFETGAAALHARLRQSLPAYFLSIKPVNLLTAPVIYSLVVPLLLLDLWATAYQRACFPGYGIPRVQRSRYIVFDRHLLGYLNGVEKLNCSYCGYANGLLAYLREIASRTEQYFCPIKHAITVASPHSRYHRFVEFGDAEGYRRELPRLKDELGEDEPPRP